MKIFINQIATILIIIQFSPLLPSLSAQSNCTLKKDKDNIKVYSCEGGSKFKSVMADFVINATLSQYVDVLLDIQKYNEWHYKVVNPRLLKKISDSELIYYTQISAPWPISNRDLVLRLKLHQDRITKVLTVTLESIPDYLPQIKNIVRVPQSYSKMTLRPVGDSKLEVHYFIQVDPGGNIPPWLANTVSTHGPYETFKKLIERLETEDKKNTVVSSVANQALFLNEE